MCVRVCVCVTQGGNRYASFETNSRQKDYTQMVENILSIFRPKKFTMVRWHVCVPDDASNRLSAHLVLIHFLQTLFAERTGFEQIENNPFESLAQEAVFRGSASCGREILHYRRVVSTHTRFSGDYSTLFGNWECVS